MIDNKLTNKAKHNHSAEVTSNGAMGNKRFWNTIKLFLRSEDLLHSYHIDITLVLKYNLITDPIKMVEDANECYINIVKMQLDKHKLNECK